MVGKKNIVVFIQKFALDISKARNYLLSVNNIADSNDSMSSLDENIQDSMIRNEGPVLYGYHPVCEARSPMSSASASRANNGTLVVLFHRAYQIIAGHTACAVMQ